MNSINEKDDKILFKFKSKYCPTSRLNLFFDFLIFYYLKIKKINYK
jgi:hypothetical protein